MTSNPVYRICRKCGLSWNVSAIYPGGKVYICPWCDYKMRQEERKQKTIGSQRKEAGV